MNNDAQLIDATLKGQSAAFGQLVTKYQDRLYHTLTHLLGSPEEAQDVAQDAFVQAFVKLDSFRGNSAFYTWLYRIAFNVAMSHRRRKKPTTSVDEAKEMAGVEPIDTEGAPERRMLESERAGQVHEALAQLSTEHRTVLVLREMDGQPYESIAEILDLPVGTVRSRLHRARLQMREQLEVVLQGELEELG